MTTPSVRLPGAFAIPSAAPLYIDGIPAGEVTVPSARVSGTQDFWSSQPRLPGDPAAEQLTVTMSQQRLINYITLDLPRFPHTMAVYWWDGAQWQPVNGNNGAPLRIITTGSVPAVVDNPAALHARMNPYHYGADHWVHHDEQIQPVLTSRLLLYAVRHTVTTGRQQFPVNPQGKQVPYPLGVRNLDFGSRILSSADVPPTTRSPVTLTMREPFTTTVDINGSPVQVAVRENRASDLLNGATWRCAPQPHATSVVNLYLDSRDGNGNAQLIDRFYLQPVTSGVRFNLYYSPTPPPPGTTFSALDDPLLAGLLNAAGTVLPVTSAAGIVFPASPGWLTLSNQAAGTVSEAPWWTAIEIMPGFTDTDPATYVIADAGLLQLSYSGNGTWTVTMPSPSAPGSVNQPSGGVLAQWAIAHNPGERIQFIAGYDGTQMFAWTPQGAIYQSPVAPPVPPAPVFRFGGLQNISPSQQVLTGNYTLTAFILKQQQLDLTAGGQGGLPPDFTAFAADASAYVYPPTVAGETTTQNAVARFHPAFILGSVCPWGFVGGLGSAYEQCSWVPLPRSYVLSKGYVEFNPVVAAAWRFEFTSLQPEPYECFKPAVVTSRHFPAHLAVPAEAASPTTPAAIDDGLGVSQAIAPSITFADAPPVNPDPVPGVPLPTEAMYATDPAAAATMAALGGSLYNFQPWQPPHIIPLQPVPGPVSYQETSVTVASRIAYFVAISAIAMYRLDYTAADDTAQYIDTFADTHNIDTTTLVPGGWSWQEGTGLIAPGNLAPGQHPAQSLVFNSAHPVTGVQFATVQSDPVQLLLDSDFSDPEFANWGPVGDAQPLAESPQTAQLGIMAQVSRGAGSPALGTSQPPSSWASLMSLYPSWSALEAACPSWLDLTLPPVSTAMGGIGYTGTPVQTTGGGRLYAAARVFSPVALTAPLFLQLLDGATGVVIAEAEQAVAGGSVTEWFAGYTLGSTIASTETWQQVQTSYPTWGATAGLTWSQVDTSQLPLGATVTAQVIQKESTGDTWDVDNISVFEDSILWEFSNDGGGTWYAAYDIRNNPRGVVTFPAAQPGQGAQLKWRLTAYAPGLSVSALAIRPWYVTWPRGIPPRAAGVGHGPNLSPADHYPAIENDPRWQLSSSPVPDSWFFSVRQALGIAMPGSDFPGPAQPIPDVVLGTALVYEPPAVAAQEPGTFSDIYTDTYTDTYAPAGAGDVYTDTYTDVYGEDYLVFTGTVRAAAAALAASAALTATAIDIPLPVSGLGADLGPVTSSDPSVSAWISVTAHSLPARRVALGNQIPATLAASPAAGEAGVRRILFDVRPDATTTPGQLSAFLADCQAHSLQCSVSIWAGADTAFTNPQDFLALYPAYAEAVHQNGYQVVLTVDNHSVTHNWLGTWYPGDDWVDVIAPTFWCTGPAPGSGGDTLAVAASFADAHGKAFGLAGFGVDHSKCTAAQGTAFLAYVQQLFTARQAAARPGYDLIYLGTGSYSVVTAPAALLAAYQALGAAV